MSDPLPLARWLASLDDDALTALLLTRQPPSRELRDFFDLADALLEPESIRHALRPFRRAELERLAEGRAPENARAAIDEALVIPDAEGGPAVPAPVAETAGLVLREHPPVDAAPDDRIRDAAQIPDAAAAVARERAFTAVMAVAELVQQLRVAPARVRARGGVTVAEEKRLGPLLAVDPELVGPLVEIAVAAGVAVVDGEELLSTGAADAWSALPPGRRWLSLAGAWLESLEPPLAEHLRIARTSDAEVFADAYPAADEALHAALAEAADRGALLGVWASSRLSAFGRALFSSNPEGASEPARASEPAPAAGAPDAADLDAELPPEVDKVYLQHDLSVIAPGPLSPALDARLRLAADLENRGVASAYRVSQQSIDRALSSGETEDSLREFLGALSLTGIPQAVDYLLAEGSRRHGLVRVRPLSGQALRGAAQPDSRTVVQSDDPTLLTALAADQALSALGLRREGPSSLSTRAAPASAYWLLLDARYPVSAEDAEGRERTMRRARVLPAPPTTAPAHPVPAAVADLVLRLREAARRSPDDADAWTARRLDRAVRARTAVTIAVRMPDGSTTRLDVVPLSLANGRLRVSDERAGVERTVPVANIVELTAL